MVSESGSLSGYFPRRQVTSLFKIPQKPWIVIAKESVHQNERMLVFSLNESTDAKKISKLKKIYDFEGIKRDSKETYNRFCASSRRNLLFGFSKEPAVSYCLFQIEQNEKMRFVRKSKSLLTTEEYLSSSYRYYNF